MRRLISRGELGSRRLVMLIFAGCSGALLDQTYPHSFNSPQPSSNSLGDACSDLDFCSSLNANETRGLATVTCRLRSAPLLLSMCGALTCVVWFPPLLVNAVPLELNFQTGVDCAW